MPRTKQPRPQRVLVTAAPDFLSKHAYVSPKLAKHIKRFQRLVPFLHRARADPEWNTKPLHVVAVDAAHRAVHGHSKRIGLAMALYKDIEEAFNDPDTDPWTRETESQTMAMSFAIDKYPNEVTLETLSKHLDQLAVENGMSVEDVKFLRRFQMTVAKTVNPVGYVDVMSAVMQVVSDVQRLADAGELEDEDEVFCPDDPEAYAALAQRVKELCGDE